MNVIKNYEIEGFDTNLLKKGQIIKIKKHLSEREKEKPIHRGENSEFLYFIKNAELKKLTLIDKYGDIHTLSLSELKPDEYMFGYYEIIEIYELNNSTFDSGVKFL